MAGKALSLLPPLLLAAAGLAGLLLLCVPTRDIREPPALKYGIVLDAGSSHTSMFIYKWPADKENDTGIVGPHSSCDVHGGGISSYADSPSGAGQSLVECLNQALRDVPKERHAGTPLYLGATAGMRLLHLTSPEASANVLAAATQTLTQYPFDFRGARILSAQDEGVFGWVTANYLLENFIKYGWVGQWFRPKKGTLGAMDLGGASTQITFETASPAEDPASEVQLRLYGQHYRVYTHSFLCYGRDQVLRRLLASALQTHGFHPCWPKGYSAHVLLQDVYESPCTAAQRPQTFNRSTKVSLSGSSDPALCRGLISELFNFSSCRFSRCSFNGIFQPPLAGKFIAFSAFFYTVDFLRTVMGLPVATLQQLEAAVVTICNQTWSEEVVSGDVEIRAKRDEGPIAKKDDPCQEPGSGAKPCNHTRRRVPAAQVPPQLLIGFVRAQMRGRVPATLQLLLFLGPPPSPHKEPPKELDSASSDEENEDGDFTVYECPGLAPTGEMEVRNPLFDHASLSAPPLQ
ncbi:Ectonucleoside triphosphate diphosphohydrolase 2, partial [Eschrichtius robustus]|nr:Ectonucleoside triphosphate diphosphohydrolase 2 [Eschrichtius robustus]